MDSAVVALATQSSARSVPAILCVSLGVRGKCWVCGCLPTFQRKVTTPSRPRHYRTDVNEQGCLAPSHPASATPRFTNKHKAKRAPPMARRTRSHALTRRTLSRAALPLCMPILFEFTPEALPISDCADARERSRVAERAGDLKRATLALEQACLSIRRATRSRFLSRVCSFCKNVSCAATTLATSRAYSTRRTASRLWRPRSPSASSQLVFAGLSEPCCRVSCARPRSSSSRAPTRSSAHAAENVGASCHF